MHRIIACETVLADFKDKPFAWGRADCMAFICAYLRAAKCHPKRIRHGQWKTERGAVRGLIKMGYPSLEALLDAHFDRVGVICARDGDIALIKAEGVWGGGAGLVAGWRVWAPGEYGLMSLPMDAGYVVWRPQCPRS
ncbi:MAG: hypothetical protein COB49_01985 [Alphaproteobacteria bacterium]|nr:MAG: hypothetical protein COB49_01985 [Alphaproteobacteria bacterium]